jgi:BirA family biotin operon repressor/biotin-[acetyl-CoA-carboxylase] ligase
MTPDFDEARLLALVRARRLPIGEPCTFRAVTESTNDDALAAARDGAPSGSLFVAGEQLRGRGRRGNTWHSSPEASLAFSLLLRPRLSVERASGLSLVVGLSVRQAVSHVLESAKSDARASVKWPNDVLVSGRKLAGILAESQVHAGKLSAAVVGVGLNLGRFTLPSDVRNRATSLAEAGATGVGREELLVAILTELSSRLAALEAEHRGEMLPKTLLDEFERFDALRGLQIAVDGVKGRAAGIDETGNLLVEGADGARSRVAAGHVEILD